MNIHNPTLKNPYNIKYDLLKDEKQIALKCSCCNYYSYHNFINIENFNYDEWKVFIKYQTKNSKDYIKSRIDDAIEISKNMNIHPTRVFNQLNSSYWAAFDWDICEQIAINHLKIKCINCKNEYTNLFEQIIKKENYE